MIQACHDQSSGALRVIDTDVASCADGETALSWSQVGPAGPAGVDGAPGAPGPQGPAGPPGGFSDVLPSWKTMRGSYDVVGRRDANRIGEGAQGVSFPFLLPSPPTVHFIAINTVPPAQCAGSASSPAAAPGQLCVYERNAGANQSVAIVNVGGSLGFADPFGFNVQVFANAQTAIEFQSRGSWAVTAP